MTPPIRPCRVMLLYWGRRGPMSRFLVDMGRVSQTIEGLSSVISVSRQSETFADFAEFGDRLMAVDTFSRGIGALTGLWRIPGLRRQLAERIRRDRIDVVVNLMSHVWTPLLASAIRQTGARYVTVIHDATRHPGDPTSLVQAFHMRDIRHADVVVTLSDAVADQLIAGRHCAPAQIERLFLPWPDYGVRATPKAPEPGKPWRLMFLGRILPYKGLSLLIDAVNILRAKNIEVELGVFGDGALGADAERLKRMGAEVANRWLSEAEISAALLRYHAVVLSHVEASQSGVAVTAQSIGLPVVSTPVGGLVEQVEDGRTGFLAESVDAPGIARAIERLIESPETYARICAGVAEARQKNSIETFLRRLHKRLIA